MDQTEIARLEALVDHWQQQVSSHGPVSKCVDKIAYARKHQASFALSKAQQLLRTARKTGACRCPEHCHCPVGVPHGCPNWRE